MNKLQTQRVSFKCFNDYFLRNISSRFIPTFEYPLVHYNKHMHVVRSSFTVLENYDMTLTMLMDYGNLARVRVDNLLKSHPFAIR